MTLAVEMQNIVKRYPNVIANDNSSLFVQEGEIHGLIGENGAGKSTMMNILYGLAEPDSGDIKIFGKQTKIASPQEAISLGISMVHQHFMLMPNLSAFQNIILGRAPTRAGVINKKVATEQIQEIMETYGLKVDLSAKIYHLSVGEMQRVEIIKALYRNAKIIILDEPTAVLTPQETDRMMEILLKLKGQGKSIIFITHKLREVMAITDRITVMRKGIVTGYVDKSETNPQELSRLMVGREVDLALPRGDFAPGDNVLEISNLSAFNARGLPALRDFTLSVRKGEVVGIAGVEGNGQTELAEVISGLLKPRGGNVKMHGTDITELSVRQRRKNGMSHVPEDRLKVGTAKNRTIMENIIVNRYYQPPYAKYGIINTKRLIELAEQMKKQFNVKTPDTLRPLSSLSGGNMQKVVFTREIETDPDLLIAAQPTRGVDIGTIEEIHRTILALRDAGKAILLISAELDEILSLSDRIAVMYEGSIAAEFNMGEADEKLIGEYMTGAKNQKYENSRVNGSDEP